MQIWDSGGALARPTDQRVGQGWESDIASGNDPTFFVVAVTGCRLGRCRAAVLLRVAVNDSVRVADLPGLLGIPAERRPVDKPPHDGFRDLGDLQRGVGINPGEVVGTADTRTIAPVLLTAVGE